MAAIQRVAVAITARAMAISISLRESSTWPKCKRSARGTDAQCSWTLQALKMPRFGAVPGAVKQAGKLWFLGTPLRASTLEEAHDHAKVPAGRLICVQYLLTGFQKWNAEWKTTGTLGEHGRK
jgi:hypothetical protein